MQARMYKTIIQTYKPKYVNDHICMQILLAFFKNL